jgi:K+-transporting ATPase KdpF subunit
MDRGGRRVVGGNGRNGGGAEQARFAEGPGEDARSVVGSTAVIGLDVLYGAGGLIAVILFAYLVFALICAEEF